MFKTKGERGAEVMINEIPTLEDIFLLIERGELSLESDEVISYYFDEQDKMKNISCVASYNQLMYLYSESKV